MSSENNSKTKTAAVFSRQMMQEAVATRKCLERIPESVFDWKPHEKSMNMLKLATLVASMFGWITQTLESSEIDFSKYEYFEPKTTAELVEFFDKNLAAAKEALGKATDEDLAQTYTLRNGEQIIYSLPKEENIRSTFSHFAHHRGQLSVYLRMNNIAVPSLYGPSADESWS
jgi:uncharacterized damage-inducible protein DinB